LLRSKAWMKLANLADLTPLLKCRTDPEIIQETDRADSTQTHDSCGSLGSDQLGAAAKLGAAAVPAIKIEGKVRVLDCDDQI
jgi:hypothetical protein